MFAVTAVSPDGRIRLLGFANSEDEVNVLVNKYAESIGGREAAAESGIRFNIELAI